MAHGTICAFLLFASLNEASSRRIGTSASSNAESSAKELKRAAELLLMNDPALAFNLGAGATPLQRHRVFNIGDDSHRSRSPSMNANPIADDIWQQSPSVRVQGDTLKTWDIGEESTQRVQLSIKSEGRPVDADIHLWHTPAYIPTKFRIYTEDGAERPIDVVIETPKSPKTVAVYNKASVDFPFDCTVANTGLGKAYDFVKDIPGDRMGERIQGGRITSWTFGKEVEAVQVFLKPEGTSGDRNMKATIELTRGPNQVKQRVDLYASVGYKNPFYITIRTPGSNNAIRILNTNTVEFPFNAWVTPYETSPDDVDQVIMSPY